MTPAAKRVRVRILISTVYIDRVAYHEGERVHVIPADARALITAGHAVQDAE